MPTLPEADFMDSATLQCPFPFYAALRAEAPVFRLPRSPLPNRDVYLVTKYDVIQDVLKDWRTFSNRFGGLMTRAEEDPELQAIQAEAYSQVDTMLTQDPPTQRIYRALATKAFSAARVQQMDAYVTEICDELIDKFVDKGTCDFFHDFAIPLPVFVIADQLGVPRSDMDRFKRWSDDSIASIGRMSGREAQLRGARSQVELQHYFAAAVEAARKAPRDDVISNLANAKYQDERLLTMSEILSILQQLLVAGNETTTNALSGGIVYVIEEDGAQDRFAEHPELIPNAVEEILRLEAPTKHMWRIVTTDTHLGGVEVPAGAALLLSYDSANRDENRFPGGEACVFSRSNAVEHLSFGGGLHFCVGALLSRKEMTIAYQRLFTRLKAIKLAPNQGPPRYFESIMHRGFDGLKLSFEKRS